VYSVCVKIDVIGLRNKKQQYENNLCCIAIVVEEAQGNRIKRSEACVYNEVWQPRIAKEQTIAKQSTRQIQEQRRIVDRLRCYQAPRVRNSTLILAKELRQIQIGYCITPGTLCKIVLEIGNLRKQEVSLSNDTREYAEYSRVWRDHRAFNGQKSCLNVVGCHSQ
jgi:hypothetical protein